ncbi:hypothetical protein FHS90_000742 [Rufibacter quisquiliarum]|uniref:Uncharacterized protein n=1 Tax=Rufibacter quisquiliarum TaxID=1549639 RepID=A0A839GCG1_9BACT|nr:hypothetical protein [Rufibacter quisquiliarum]
MASLYVCAAGESRMGTEDFPFLASFRQNRPKTKNPASKFGAGFCFVLVEMQGIEPVTYGFSVLCSRVRQIGFCSIQIILAEKMRSETTGRSNFIKVGCYLCAAQDRIKCIIDVYPLFANLFLG